MGAPVISVCLLAHNSARYIRTAIESVLAQTFADWELLISDDASTDETGKIAKSYLGDSRIRYVLHNENLKQPRNWAYAIEHTSAPFIATLHADDVWEHDTLEHYTATLQKPGWPDLVWGRWNRTDSELCPLAHQPPPSENRTLVGHEALIHLFKTNQCLPSVLAFRRSIVNRAGLPNPNYGMLCDRDYVLRLCQKAQLACELSAVLARYRVHTESVTTTYTNNGKLLRELDEFHYSLPYLLAGIPGRERLRSDYERDIGEYYFRAAMNLKLSGEHDQADRRLKHALDLNPRLLVHPRFLIKWTVFQLGKYGEFVLRRIHGVNSHVKDRLA